MSEWFKLNDIPLDGVGRSQLGTIHLHNLLTECDCGCDHVLLTIYIGSHRCVYLCGLIKYRYLIIWQILNGKIECIYLIVPLSVIYNVHKYTFSNSRYCLERSQIIATILSRGWRVNF